MYFLNTYHVPDSVHKSILKCEGELPRRKNDRRDGYTIQSEACTQNPRNKT